MRNRIICLSLLLLGISAAGLGTNVLAQSDTPADGQAQAERADGSVEDATATDEPPIDATGEVVDIDATDLPPTSEPACFNVRDVRNFHAFDDRHMYVEGRRDQHFLLTMFGVCPGLRGAFNVEFSNYMNRVCSNSSARVRFRSFGQIQTCRVRLVEGVESRETAEEIVGLRRQAER
jgi:hypothetical protein